MTTPIIDAKKVIEAMPQNSSYDEIIRELAFDKMIKQGLEDSKNSNTISKGPFKNLCQSGKITITQGYRNRCRAICS